VPHLGYLEPRNFADDLHRVVYQAIRSLGDTSAPSAAERVAALARAADQEVSEEYVRKLAASCPDPRHGAAYGTRLIQATLYREMADRADVLAANAALLGYDGTRVTEPGGADGQEAGEIGQHLALVAAALRRHTVPLIPGGAAGASSPETGQLTESHSQDQDAVPAPATRVRAIPQDHATLPSADVPTPASHPDRKASDQERREENVLTALLQRHRESDEILAFLPAAAFASPSRQEIFRAIHRLYRASQPVDELTVAWELATGSDPASQQPGRPDPDVGAYVARLASASIDGRSPRKDASGLLRELDRRTVSTPAPAATALGQAAARHALAVQPDRVPAQASPSAIAGPPGATGPQQGPEQRR
jgi:hypothetical protein